MDKRELEEIKKRIIKTKKKFGGITGLPTDFKVETTNGTYIFDDEMGEFVKPNSPWMADNPRRWMADNSDAKDPEGTERLVLGAIGRPDGGADAYFQRFQGGELVSGNRDSFLGFRDETEMIEKNSPQIQEIVDEKVGSLTNQEAERLKRKAEQKEKEAADARRRLEEYQNNRKVFTQHHQILQNPKK